MTTSNKHSNRPPKSSCGLASFLRSKTLGGVLPALILALFASTPRLVGQATVATSTGENQGNQRWSVAVESVDLGDVNLDPRFGDAIYENLLEELAKTKKFRQVFRDGDHYTYEGADILVLKTRLQKDRRGSEARRSASTLPGPIKLNVHIQLLTPDNHLVLDQVVEGNVRFSDTNLRATHNLARSITATLKKSTLPSLTTLVRADESANATKYRAATITGVQLHEATDSGKTSVASYDVSLKVSDMVYVVLYTPPSDSVDTIRYGTGGEVHILLGENTITFHDELGNSLQAPILSKTTVTGQSSQ